MPEPQTIQHHPQQKPLLSVAEAARRLGISESAAYRLAAADALPGLVRLPGARMWVRARVLESWLAGQDPPGAAPVPMDRPWSPAAR